MLLHEKDSKVIDRYLGLGNERSLHTLIDISALEFIGGLIWSCRLFSINNVID